MALLGNFTSKAWWRKARDAVAPNGNAEHKYSSLGNENGSASSNGAYATASPLRRFVALWSRKRIALLVLTVFLLSSFLVFGSGSIDTPFLNPFSQNRDLETDKKNLHLVVPATKGDFQLCKLMLASSILAYPTPRLINWGLEIKTASDGGFQLGGGTHLAKVTGVIKYLWALEPHQMQDIVVVIDAYDLTLQLPPEILLKQYYRTNDDMNARMAKKPGMRRAMKEHGFYQTVVFSADKRCSPQLPWEPWCYLQPESPLSPTIFGNRTDTKKGWDDDFTQSYRPRWLNSGMVMGPAADMLAIFMRAYQQMANQKLGSDQSLFNMAFAEQEYTREYWRQHSLKWYDNTPGKSISDMIPRLKQKRDRFDELTDREKIVDIIDPSSKHHKLLEPAFLRNDTEYHMGLDYLSRLSKTTASTGHELRSLIFNSTPPTGNLTKDPRDCQTEPPVLRADFAKLPPPFPPGFSVAGHPLPPQKWSDCPLWVDMCSREVPASIHHNGAKFNTEFQWPLMWYQRYAKAYLELRRSQAKEATEAALAAGSPVPDINDGRVWNGDKKLDFGDVCPGSYTAMFIGCQWGNGWDCDEKGRPMTTGTRRRSFEFEHGPRL